MNRIVRGDMEHSAPTVVFVNDFDEEAAHKFSADFDEAHRTGQTIIPVVIDSFGGEANALMSMIDTIQGSTIPVVTVAKGKACSAGAILFTFAYERVMTPNATLMFHQIGGRLKGQLAELEASVRDMVSRNKGIIAMMTKNTGVDFKPIYAKNVDAVYTAKQAKAMGLATRIGNPTFEMEIDVKYSLVVK